MILSTLHVGLSLRRSWKGEKEAIESESDEVECDARLYEALRATEA